MRGSGIQLWEQHEAGHGMWRFDACGKHYTAVSSTSWGVALQVPQAKVHSLSSAYGVHDPAPASSPTPLPSAV